MCNNIYLDRLLDLEIDRLAKELRDLLLPRGLRERERTTGERDAGDRERFLGERLRLRDRDRDSDCPR